MSRLLVAASLVVVALVGAFALGRATAPGSEGSRSATAVEERAPASSEVPDGDDAEPTALDEVLVPAGSSRQPGTLLVLSFGPIDECYPRDAVTDVDVLESPDSVVITAKSVPGSSVEQPGCEILQPWLYRNVVLREPLGTRTILDGSCGLVGTRCELVESQPARTGEARARSFALAAADAPITGPYRDGDAG